MEPTGRTLVIDTATPACSVALFDGADLIAHKHAILGRGHAERLVPMIAGLPDSGRADAILVDVGPGSFTGIRVGVAAARGLALGWQATVAGYSSMALVAAAEDAGEITVVLEGGHGEVFVQSFDGALIARTSLASLSPADALAAVAGQRVVGNGVPWLQALDPALDARDALPDAIRALQLPPAARALPPRPIYGRPPDAKAAA